MWDLGKSTSHSDPESILVQMRAPKPFLPTTSFYCKDHNNRVCATVLLNGKHFKKKKKAIFLPLFCFVWHQETNLYSHSQKFCISLNLVAYCQHTLKCFRQSCDCWMQRTSIHTGRCPDKCCLPNSSSICQRPVDLLHKQEAFASFQQLKTGNICSLPKIRPFTQLTHRLFPLYQ